ncbi:aldehyde dehydrogenase [Hoyosella rhizosphaerae]|uniref:Aldehyde dehydrogenase n=1 Tax=Hoyosella rhizosphaerae TaxID=1755582 RepID=A0A916XAM8_9ACTN|nr:aldehyde dehydrogenase family protein [Hoyosella rhizosphaerae]MBN4926622.1 aldehyde dehydrogenase [Hoyosella rhizosphaerae]GGC57833.1 putative aldehyde dehydrogenase [Hoyosella rhizosphaerae]
MPRESSPPPSSFPNIDTALAELSAGEKLWGSTPLVRRRELLDQIRLLTGQCAEQWVEAASAIKDLPAESALVGEEWMSGPYPVITATAALAETVQSLDGGKSPLDNAEFSQAPGARVAVKVLPLNAFDTLLMNGFRANVWLQPGVTEDEARSNAGLAQRNPTETHGIGVVLGAGNITSIAPLDVLYELFAHNRVVILKLNPIMDRMLPVFQKVFRPLIDFGVVRIVTGGADVGTYLVNHDAVAHVHMTGSAVTHDAIVFGTGEEGEKRKRDNAPLLTKPITSELGGVSPVIIIPGEWSAADIKFQAEHVATQRLHNGGYNCVASQIVVVPAEWAQKEQFLTALREVLTNAPPRTPYYPGSDQRISSALDTHEIAEKIGTRVLISGITSDSPALHTEYFAPVLAVAELPGDAADFLANAVAFANEHCAGTLGVNLVAHPNTINSLGKKLDQAIEDLHYGTVALNAWTGVGYLTARATWGAFPGHTLNDVQSGIGVVHNAFLIDKPERTVVYGPFRPAPRSLLNRELALSPRPPWFVTNTTAATTGRRLTEFSANPSWVKLPGIFASALRG